MKNWEYIIKTKKSDIDFINKIIEVQDGMANVRTLNSEEGLIKILTNNLCNINAITSKDGFEHTEILNNKIEGLEFYFEQKVE